MKEIFESYVENAFDPNAQEYIARIKRLWHFYNFMPFFPEDKNSELLDIGPGRGEMLSTMKESGYSNFMGIDISPSVVDYCNEKGLPCELVESTEEWLNNNKGRFELITLLDVLEHVPKANLVGFMTACYNAITETGKIIIEVPNLQSPEGFLHRYNDITHEIGLTEHTLGQLLMTVGFKQYDNFPFEEFVEGGEDEEHLKRVRAFYWKLVTSYRKLTHNLEPRILTPEFFCVAYKKESSDVNANRVLLENDTLSMEDIDYFCSKYGLNIEFFRYITELWKNVERLDRNDADRQSEVIDLQDHIAKLHDHTTDLRKNNDSCIFKIEGLTLLGKQLEQGIADEHKTNESLKLEIQKVMDQNIKLGNEISLLRSRLDDQKRLIDRIPKFLIKREK